MHDSWRIGSRRSLGNWTDDGRCGGLDFGVHVQLQGPLHRNLHLRVHYRWGLSDMDIISHEIGNRLMYHAWCILTQVFLYLLAREVMA